MHPGAFSLASNIIFAERQVWTELGSDREVKARRRKGFSFAWRANDIGDRALLFIALTRLVIDQYALSMMSSL